MTQQIREYLEAEDRSYVVDSFDGEKQFDPELLGLKIDGASTACRSGWHANWRLMQGRLYLRDLFVYTDRCPTICRVRPEIGDCRGVYHDIMLPMGFTGQVTVIPREDEFRARWLYVHIAPDDQIIPLFVLNFDLGRLKSVSNESYLVPANVDEDEPGQQMREGRIFGDVPTPFDELNYKDFTQWE
jgi:hypothetical protein